MSLYEEKGGQLVPTGGVPGEVVAAIERADDEAIVEHLITSSISEEYLYSYEIQGKPIVGISVSGAKEVARELGNIEVLPDFKLDKDSDPNYIYATMRARDLTRNTTLAGFGRQCKYYLTTGNVPTDRINEHAFVIALSKAQRNAILSVAPQEAIAKIIQSFKEQNKIKKLPPSYSSAPRPQPTKVEPKAEDTLKKLRQQVGIEAGKVFPSEDARKVWQKMEYNVTSMTELDKGQLEDMLSKVKAMAPEAPKPLAIDNLGFSSEDERAEMKKRLIDLIRTVGYSSNAEVIKYAADKGWKKTYEATKDELESYIEEVEQEKKAIDEAESITEDSKPLF